MRPMPYFDKEYYLPCFSLSISYFLPIHFSRFLSYFDSDLENSDPIVAVVATTIDVAAVSGTVVVVVVCHFTLQCFFESHSTQFILV